VRLLFSTVFFKISHDDGYDYDNNGDNNNNNNNNNTLNLYL